MNKIFSILLCLVASLLILSLLFCTEIFSSSVVNSNAQYPVSQSITELEADLDSIMKEITTPGAAVAIVSPDSIIWIGTFGFSNIETNELVNEHTHFCIGSCTKSFTGLAFLKLLGEGRIDLDMPVKEIAPEIEIDNPWADSHPVRVIHLIEHTTGFEDSHPNWFYFEGPVLSLQDALEVKGHLRKVRWQPGTRFGYSSAGFTLAGYVLEKITGLPYAEYLKQSLLIPIGMVTTTIGSSDECRSQLAVGYDRNCNPFPVWYDYDEPAGALNSSIREMALFVQFLLNGGASDNYQIIDEELYNYVGKPVTTLAAKAGLKSGYSFGIGMRYEGGARWYGHGGAVPGFLAEYYYNLDHGLGFVVLQNSFDISFYDNVFNRVWSYVTSKVDSIIPPSAIVPTSELDMYCGYYEPRNPRLQIARFAEILTGGVKVFRDDDTLYTQGFMDSKSPLIPVSRCLFRRPWHPEATRIFASTPEGRMVYASQGSYFERTAIWKIYIYRILIVTALILMMSSIVYALVWIPIYLYKRIKHHDNQSKHIRIRLFPLLAVLSLVLGILKMGDQTILEFGMMTLPNVIFYMSTLIFAVLATVNLFNVYRSYYQSVNIIERVYTSLLAAACFGMTLYFIYWGVIGLKLWEY